MSVAEQPRMVSAGEPLGRFARLGMALADWSQKWFPDAFVFALVAVIVVFLAGLVVGAAPRDLVKYFGDGFWSLIPFTMQMAVIIIGSYVVAASPPVHRLIRRLAAIPRTPARRSSLRGLFLHGHIADQLGLRADLRRHPGARNSAATCAASTIAPSAPPHIWERPRFGRWVFPPQQLC